MRYYKYKRRDIRVISFDLDDTLYNNQDVIRAAEQAFINHLTTHYPALSNITNRDTKAIRQRVISAYPHLKHDVTNLRKAWLTQLFAQENIPYRDKDIATAFAAFMLVRNNVKLSSTTKAVLTELSQHFTLIAISNGNLDPSAAGLTELFQHCFFAGHAGKMKPEPDLFLAACRQLNISPSQLLHVGDNLHTDILGAQRVGAMSCWYNPYNIETHYPIVPDLQIDTLESLLKLT